LIGTKLAHFKVTAELGKGGMGEVYQATDTKLGREVAIKILPDECTCEPERLARFEREARMLAALNHPNIVTIHSIEEAEGRHLLVMELVEGTTLSDALPEGGLPLKRFFKIATQLTEALAAAHEKGVTHRDLKPGNVMLRGEDEVKLLDLGMAKLLPRAEPGAIEATTESVTQAGQLLGTVRYMSPEQAEGRPADPRSDIFSLGILLFEMATGRSPFQGETNLAMLTAIVRDEPRQLGEVREEFPPQVGRIVGRCLHKDPQRRYRSALEVHKELEALQQETSSITNATVSMVSRPAPSRSRLLTLTALAATIAIALYFAFGRQLVSDRSTRAAQSEEIRSSAISIVPFTVRGNPEFDYLGEGIVDLLSAKLDGAGDLRSVDPNAVLSYVSQTFEEPLTPADTLSVAEHFASGLYLTGEIVEAGGRLHVSASLYQVGESAAVSQASVEGAAEDLFGLIDELAAELVTEQFSGPGAQFTRIAAVTTESLPALKAYLQAESELRGGRFTSSLGSFQRTLELDPEFALAWYRLSVAAEWALRNDLVEPAAEQAVRLSDRLSDRYRKLLEARLASRQARASEAEHLYRTILGTYPDDVEAWTQLAEVQSHYSHLTGISMTQSREAWERVRELEPDLVLALWHLARVEAIDQREQALSDTVDRILELAPEAERSFEIIALRTFNSGTAEEQETFLAGLDGVADGVVALVAWNLALTMDDVFGTAAVAKVLTDPARSPEAQGLGHSILAYTALAQGRWRDAGGHLSDAGRVAPHLGLEHRGLLSSMPFVPVAREELESLHEELLAWDATEVPRSGIPSFFFARADGFHPQIRLYLLGLVSARLGDEAALGYAASLENDSASSSEPTVLQNLAHGVRAAWWRYQGDDERAREVLDQMDNVGLSYQDSFASPFFSQPSERLQLGELAMKQGDTEEARRWLSSLAEISFFDDALVPLSHFYRGELYEGLGDRESAAVHYRRFLELWPDPDPELRGWVERAKAGLGRVTS
jgi:serine/threonine protein kinase